MLWIQVRRILRSGFVSFWRNSFVSLSSVLVMVVTLSVISAIIFSSTLLTTTLENIKNKVDVNVYFETSTSEEEVLAVKTEIEKIPEVARVDYQSRDAALEEFKLAHADNPEIINSLKELGENPLSAVLSIKAKEPSQYELIANYLSANYPAGSSIVEEVNYFKNKLAIDRLSTVISAGRQLGSILTVLFILISIIITLNTVRLAIFISRDEIQVMKLVGASNAFIRGPFVVIGAAYGLFAAIITLAILWPITYWLGPFTDQFLVGVNIFTYFKEHFGQMFLLLTTTGVAIGAISSYLAVKKFLK